MSTPPRLPGKEVIKRIADQLARFDRAPFQQHLATALSVGPSLSSWRKQSKKNPEAWARSVASLAKVAGFAERKETLNLTLDPEAMSRELVARYGTTKAQTLLEAAGLPVSLIPTVDIVPEPIEGELTTEHGAGSIEPSTEG